MWTSQSLVGLMFEALALFLYIVIQYNKVAFVKLLSKTFKNPTDGTVCLKDK